MSGCHVVVVFYKQRSFHATSSFQIKYIYDETFAVHPGGGCPATFTNILMGKSTVGELYIRRYRTADIPRANDNEIKNFLMQVYKEKDELIDSYLKTRGNSFTENNNFKNFPVSIVSFIQHEGKLMVKNTAHGNALSE